MWGVATITAATLSGIPEFVPSEQHLKALAEASAKAARHMPAVMTEKQQDFMTLAATIATTAFVQYRAYTERTRAERARDITPAAPIMATPTDQPNNSGFETAKPASYDFDIFSANAGDGK